MTYYRLECVHCARSLSFVACQLRADHVRFCSLGDERVERVDADGQRWLTSPRLSPFGQAAATTSIVVARPSTLGPVFGLFARQPIACGALIADYCGQRIDRTEAARRVRTGCGERIYPSPEQRHRWYIDGAASGVNDAAERLGAFVHDATDVAESNARFELDSASAGRIRVVATRAIACGDEIVACERRATSAARRRRPVEVWLADGCVSVVDAAAAAAAVPLAYGVRADDATSVDALAERVERACVGRTLRIHRECVRVHRATHFLRVDGGDVPRALIASAATAFVWLGVLEDEPADVDDNRGADVLASWLNERAATERAVDVLARPMYNYPIN